MPDGWAWHMISDAGRIVAYSPMRWASDIAAAAAAKAYRTRLWAIADTVDHRQARAI